MDRWERNFFSGEGAEPGRFVGARFEFDGDGSFLWQIHGVNLSGPGQTISAIVDQFIVRSVFHHSKLVKKPTMCS